MVAILSLRSMIYEILKGLAENKNRSLRSVRFHEQVFLFLFFVTSPSFVFWNFLPVFQLSTALR